MNIYEALEKLDGFFDMLSATGFCSDEELEMMGEIEDTLYQFARKYEPPQKKLPLEFTCTCGKHLLRHDIYGDMSRFMCDECKSEWLVRFPEDV